MSHEQVRKNYGLVTQMIALIVKDAFKTMARDETLSRFLIETSEPAIILDLQVMAQREALDLAELALLELVDSKRWNEQLALSSRRIQERFQEAFGEKGASTYLAADLLDERFQWLDLRAQFFRQILSLKCDAEVATDLLREAFRTWDSFNEWLERLHRSDQNLAQKTLSFAPALLRFLLAKYFECERDALLSVSREFADEAFKTMPKLKGS